MDPKPESEVRAKAVSGQLTIEPITKWVEIRLSNGAVIGYVDRNLGDFSNARPSTADKSGQK
jgi:hypothetical protein